MYLLRALACGDVLFLLVLLAFRTLIDLFQGSALLQSYRDLLEGQIATTNAALEISHMMCVPRSELNLTELSTVHK